LVARTIGLSWNGSCRASTRAAISALTSIIRAPWRRPARRRYMACGRWRPRTTTVARSRSTGSGRRRGVVA
jgi:hypothetical protein